ncbi:MAG: hypothetical protein ACRCUS_07600 [Anaerovoracaceae bacterium]
MYNLVMTKEFLIKLIHKAIDEDLISLSDDIFSKNLESIHLQGYKYEGYYSYIDSLETYLKSNLDLLNADVRKALFAVPYMPILTEVKDSPPTKYGEDAKVENSIIADGCIIEGEVKNSIIFRGVKVDSRTCITNSVIMGNCIIGNDATLNCVIADKGVIVKDGRILSGHPTMPFHIKKGSII